MTTVERAFGEIMRELSDQVPRDCRIGGGVITASSKDLDRVIDILRAGGFVRTNRMVYPRYSNIRPIGDQVGRVDQAGRVDSALSYETVYATGADAYIDRQRLQLPFVASNDVDAGLIRASIFFEQFPFILNATRPWRCIVHEDCVKNIDLGIECIENRISRCFFCNGFRSRDCYYCTGASVREQRGWPR